MKSTTRRNIALLLVLTIAVSMFAMFGCSTSEDPNATSGISAYTTPKPVPKELGGAVTLSTYRTAENDYSAFTYIQEYILQYPGVEVTNDNEYTYEEYFSTLDQRVRDGSIGDVFLVDSDHLAEYVEEGLVMNLSKYLNGLVEYTSGDFNKLVPEKLYYASVYKNSLYNNKFYMVPTEYSNKAVFINADMFEKAGLSIPADSWTWDDVCECAKALKEAGCKNPISLDYTDYDVWGSFALGQGGQIFRTVDEKTGELTMNLTDPLVVSGLKKFADDFLVTGLVAEKTPDQISNSEIKDYGMVVISHSNLGQWYETLNDETFDWEFAHYPRFAAEEDEFNYNIGIKTIGLAVRVREYDDEMTEDDIRMQNEICAQLALYAMVPEAAVCLAGSSGFRVPALASANLKRFWRQYPVEGKNTSVFSLYHDYDYPATFTATMTLKASGEIIGSVGEAIKKYADSNGEAVMDELLQEIQNNINANW